MMCHYNDTILSFLRTHNRRIKVARLYVVIPMGVSKQFLADRLELLYEQEIICKTVIGDETWYASLETEKYLTTNKKKLKNQTGTIAKSRNYDFVKFRPLSPMPKYIKDRLTPNFHYLSVPDSPRSVQERQDA